MNPKVVSSEKIMQLVTSHWSLKALTVAVEMSVFTSLKDKELTAMQLSERLGAPPRSLTRLLNANAALGFLDKSGDNYRNSEVAETYLVEGMPAYLGDFIKLAGIYGYSRWVHFKECIVNDSPIEDIYDDFRNNEERIRYFIKAMHNNAKLTAGFLTRIPHLHTRKHLLDLGGGSGVYSMVLTEKYPDLHATLIDFPLVCKVAREFISESPGKERIEILEGDLLTDEFAVEGDVILLSQVLHGMPEPQCRSLIKRCYDWTAPGGMIIIHEFILDESKAGPLHSVLFALNMLVTTSEGDAYTKSELLEWLEAAGYREISCIPTPGPSTFLIGWRR